MACPENGRLKIVQKSTEPSTSHPPPATDNRKGCKEPNFATRYNPIIFFFTPPYFTPVSSSIARLPSSLKLSE